MTNEKPEPLGDLWRTPKEVFNALDREFNFYADMACSEQNKLCDLGFTEKDDSLNFDWAERMYSARPSELNQYVWLNCPYSNPLPWVIQALRAQSKGLGVVMLLNDDTSVGWFAEALQGVSEVRHIIGEKKIKGKGYHSGRIAFINHEGKPIKGNNKPQFVLVFNPHKIGAKITSYVKLSEFYK